MNTQSLNLPEDLGYTARHVWARKDGDTLVIGITDFAQDQLGEILVRRSARCGRFLRSR